MEQAECRRIRNGDVQHSLVKLDGPGHGGKLRWHNVRPAFDHFTRPGGEQVLQVFQVLGGNIASETRSTIFWWLLHVAVPCSREDSRFYHKKAEESTTYCAAQDAGCGEQMDIEKHSQWYVLRTTSRAHQIQ